MNKYICIEAGDSAYTEFLMKNGTYERTEDGIFLGIVNAKNENDAIKKIKKAEHNLNRRFDHIVVYEIKNVCMYA